MSKKKNYNNNKTNLTEAEKAEAEKLELEKIEAEKAEAEKDKEPEYKGNKYTVKSDLGFTKRNYSVGGKRILLVAGEWITEADYLLFNDRCKKLFFEA